VSRVPGSDVPSTRAELIGSAGDRRVELEERSPGLLAFLSAAAAGEFPPRPGA
jgi:hypothetical protein